MIALIFYSTFLLRCSNLRGAFGLWKPTSIGSRTMASMRAAPSCAEETFRFILNRRSLTFCCAISARHRDRVVSKEELLTAVWAGRVVSESTLSSRLTAVRHAVGDGGRVAPIQTVHCKGFRFVGTVHEDDTESDQETGRAEAINEIGSRLEFRCSASRVPQQPLDCNSPVRKSLYRRGADAVDSTALWVRRGGELYRTIRRYWLSRLAPVRRIKADRPIQGK